jgi:O-antigen ligase
MAKQATLLEPVAERAGSLAMAGFGLMASLPFLVPLHQLPLTSFHSEWLAALLGVLAILLWLVQTPAITLRLPVIAIAPLALMLVVALQWALGMFAYAATAITVLLYLAWAGLITVAASSMAGRFGERRLLSFIAWALLAGGMVNGVFGILQQLRLPVPFLIPADVPGSGVYGNLAQQNHFATHMALALASAIYLRVSGQLALRIAAPAGALLLLALAMSASRSSILYVGWLALLLVLLFRKNISSKRLALSLVSLALAFLLMLLALGSLSSMPLFERMMAMQGAFGPRRFAWELAGKMFAGAPLLGVGFDAFAFNMVGQLERAPVAVVWGIDQYAHNLFLQLLAVSGLCGLLAVLLPGLQFVRQQLTAPRSAERMWIGGTLGVLFIHSMLEQPLYYTYFLGVAALIAGAADARPARVKLSRLAALAGAAVMVLALVLLARTFSEYRQLTAYFGGGPAYVLAERGQFIRDLRAHSLLGPLAELMSPGDIVPANAPIADKLQLSERARHFAPTADAEFRHAALLAEAGQQEQAKRQFVRAATAYPADTPYYVARLAQVAQGDMATYGELAAFGRTFRTR